MTDPQMAKSDAPIPRLLDILRGSDLFQDLTAPELDKILTNLRMIRTQKGFEIIRQGDSWDSFYIIISGRVSVKVKKGNKTNKVAELGKNEFFGEMALLVNQPRNATITSEEVSELLVLRKAEFDSVLMQHPVRAEKIRGAFMNRKHKLRRENLNPEWRAPSHKGRLALAK
ncbi:MAG TPA: cyclic nucleotide-binding domain-containing protein [bacterium]|nr:cyclic nucleotide-binding domain-containing protein [bacterium]